jgi:hypothetical protein
MAILRQISSLPTKEQYVSAALWQMFSEQLLKKNNKIECLKLNLEYRRP